MMPPGWSKRLKSRAIFWLLFLSLGILIDEWIKEGYLFKVEDIWAPYLTHEKLIVINLIALLLIILLRRLSFLGSLVDVLRRVKDDEYAGS